MFANDPRQRLPGRHAHQCRVEPRVQAPRARVQVRAACVVTAMLCPALLLLGFCLSSRCALGFQLPDTYLAEGDGADCNEFPTCDEMCFIGYKEDNNCPKAPPNNYQLRCACAQGGTGTVYGTKCEQSNNAGQDCDPLMSTDQKTSSCTDISVWLCTTCMVDNGQNGDSHTSCDYSSCPCMGNPNGGTTSTQASHSCTTQPH